MVPEILEQLAFDAGNLLAGSAKQGFFALPALEPFSVGALGNFPFYWQNPANLQFNHLTYNWISANLKANSSPVQLDQSFNNYYIEALGSISYQLSKSDLAQLSQAKQNATNQQFALLSAWQAAYGSIPPATATQQPIDLIVQTIVTTWATPPTDWTLLQNAADLNTLLNNMPASGKTIAPVLSQYLNALGSSISLQNAVSMNTGCVQQALAAVQNPSTTNGGMSTDDGKINPAYTVATPLADILDSLNNSADTISLKMLVSPAQNTGGYSVTLDNGASVNTSEADFFSLIAENNQDFFNSLVINRTNPVQLEMNFNGVTMVNFGPVPYNFSTAVSWYWMKPITDAVKNGTNDVSGFKFSPNPQIDFSAAGSFGYLTGAAIAAYPTVKLTAIGADYQSVAARFQQNSTFDISFLGVSLQNESRPLYSLVSQVDDANTSVTITMSPPPQFKTGETLTSVGWVLGVQTTHPAS